MLPLITLLADGAAPWIAGRQWTVLIVLTVVGVVMITLALALRYRRSAQRLCPKCRFDMRATPSLRCPECGSVAASESMLHRGRPRRVLLMFGLAALVCYPTYRSVVWSKSRGWSPPLSEWHAVQRIDLPHGAVAEVLEPRSPWGVGQRARIRSADGSTLLLNEHRFWLGGERSDGNLPRVGLGDDITGNGMGNLVIVEWSGGAHCCEKDYIFEISRDGVAREVAVIDARDGGGFEDLDGDGVYEFVMSDWSLAYDLTCFACLRHPKIILRWNQDEYVVAADMMWREAPTDHEIAAIVIESLAADWNAVTTDQYTKVRDRLWGMMLRLIYSGHESEAWWLFDQCWPSDAPSREQELAGFREAIEESPFRQAIVDLQQDADRGFAASRGG